MLNIQEGYNELPAKPIKVSGSNILCLGDLHFNFHNKRAIETAINYKDKYDAVIIAGDMLDLYQCSRFTKDPSYFKIKDEIATGIQFIEYLRAKFKGARIIYLEGNHEQRLAHHLWRHSAALEGIEALKLESLLQLNRLGVEYIENGNILQAGKCNIIHGNETRVGGGINVARTTLLRTLENTVFFHFHKTQFYKETTMLGKEFATWAVGCLCNLKPKYMPLAKWTWGFAHIEIDKQNFKVHNKQILSDYEIV
jgi:predicted phosphodiesterase